MTMIEIRTPANKLIAFADNGVLSIKCEEVMFGRLTKEQALNLAFTMITWASKQPNPS